MADMGEANDKAKSRFLAKNNTVESSARQPWLCIPSGGPEPLYRSLPPRRYPPTQRPDGSEHAGVLAGVQLHEAVLPPKPVAGGRGVFPVSVQCPAALQSQEAQAVQTLMTETAFALKKQEHIL